MLQIMTGHEECVQMLLEQEVSILCKDSRGRTPLHYAAARGHATWLSELLQMALSEEDCSFKDNQGYTPLHWACYNGELIVTWLIPVDFLSQHHCDIKGSENITWCYNQGIHSFCIQILQNKQTKIPFLENIFPSVATMMPYWNEKSLHTFS